MRKLFAQTPAPFWLICGALLIYLAFIWLRAPYQPKLWMYPLARELSKASVLYKMGGLAVQESAHFIIKYNPQDQAAVAMIIDAAEAAYEPVTNSLGFTPSGKETIIIITGRQEMQKNFSWSGEQSAIGVYWSGLIEVLSPQAWLYTDNIADQKDYFIKNGPITHEFTHLVVDAAARGNYPRWFTEGLAQYQEYRLNGYEWITATNTLEQDLYSLAELERDFDGLPNQSLAYRESFAAVCYLYETYGDEGVRVVLRELNQGKTMRRAIKKVTKLDYNQFELAWQQWGRTQMPHQSQER